MFSSPCVCGPTGHPSKTLGKGPEGPGARDSHRGRPGRSPWRSGQPPQAWGPGRGQSVRGLGGVGEGWTQAFSLLAMPFWGGCGDLTEAALGGCMGPWGPSGVQRVFTIHDLVMSLAQGHSCRLLERKRNGVYCSLHSGNVPAPTHCTPRTWEVGVTRPLPRQEN